MKKKQGNILLQVWYSFSFSFGYYTGYIDVVVWCSFRKGWHISKKTESEVSSKLVIYLKLFRVGRLYSHFSLVKGGRG